MTKRLVLILTAVTLVAAFTPLFVSTKAAEVNCRIPFSFTVGSATLPPDAYTMSTRGNALVIRGSHKAAIVLSTRMQSRVETGAKMVFDKYGDLYILREVWTGAGSGRELPRTKVNPDRRSGLDGVATRVVISAM